MQELKTLQNTYSANYLFERISPLNFLFIIYYLIKSLVLKHFKFYGLFGLRSGKSFEIYIGLKRTEPIGLRTRHYLSPILGIDGFFCQLNEHQIRYCVLRWFEQIPEIKLDEDIDLLVEDADLEKLYSVIDSRPGILPFDIYSVTGKPGSDYQSLPYYIHALAEKALGEIVLFNGKFKVPSAENYFYLLAYHAVFHKGESSGLESKYIQSRNRIKPDHDYLSHLKRIAVEAKLPVSDFTLEGLHILLQAKGFAPPIDTLYKLSINNDYLKVYLKDYQKNSEHPSGFEGLVCFVAREKILEKNLLHDLIKYIRKEGFTVIKIKHLEEPYRENFTRHVRGGNWNQGPWPVSGGLPAVLIVALDVYPVKPHPSDYDLHPGITNRRIINKNEIRDFINNSLPSESEWFNGVHSSDNEFQALDYLSLAGIETSEIYEEIVNHKKSFTTTFPVLSVLSQYSKRAKVELIEFNGVKAVKKTFKPDCEIFLKNEVTVYSLFQGLLPIPKLFETRENYIITSYIKNSKPLPDRINIKLLIKCLKVIRQLYDAGYSLLDFKPANFLIDDRQNLYLVDFEFLFKYENKPGFMDCYDLVGSPESLDNSLIPNYSTPKGVKQFDWLWYDHTGVYYQELNDLINPGLMVKSFIRYYKLRARNSAGKFIRLGKKAIKKVFRHLP